MLFSKELNAMKKGKLTLWPPEPPPAAWVLEKVSTNFKICYKSTHSNKIGFDFFCQQVALNAGHDVLEVESRDEPSAVFVESAEGLNGIFLVKVLPMEKLRICLAIESKKNLRAKTGWTPHSWRLVSFLFQSRALQNHHSCQTGFSGSGLFSSLPPRTHLKIDSSSVRHIFINLYLASLILNLKENKSQI
jgi:hypothetical protein